MLQSPPNALLHRPPLALFGNFKRGSCTAVQNPRLTAQLSQAAQVGEGKGAGRGAAAAVKAPHAVASEHAHAAPQSVVDYKKERAKALTKQISSCRDLAQLAAVCLQQQQQLTPIHISAALTVCAKRLQRGYPDHGSWPHARHGWMRMGLFVDHMLELLVDQLQLSSGREISTVLWCLAKLGHPTPGFVLRKLVNQYLDVAHASCVQTTATVLYALAKLGTDPEPAVLDSLLQALTKSCVVHGSNAKRQQFNPRLISQPSRTERHVLQALQVSGSPLGVSLQPGQQQLIPQTLSLLPLMPAQPGQQTWSLATSIWALVRLQQPAAVEKWLPPLLSLLHGSSSGNSCINSDPAAVTQQLEVQSLLRHIHAGQDRKMLSGAPCSYCAAVVLWACAEVACRWPGLQFSQHEQEHPQAAKNYGQLQVNRSRFLSTVVKQSSLLLHAYEDSLVSLQPQSAVMLLQAVNRLRLQPSQRWCQAYFTALEGIAHQLNPAQGAAVLCGAAYLPVHPSAALCAKCLSAVRLQLHNLSAAQLGLVLRACGRLRIRPPVQFVQNLLDAFLASHQQPTPAAVSMLLHAASKVGYKPAASSIDALLKVVKQQRADFRSHDVARLLFGCAALQLQLPQSLQHTLLQTFLDSLQEAGISDITLVLRALASWQQQQQHQDAQGQQQVSHWLMVHKTATTRPTSASHPVTLWQQPPFSSVDQYSSMLKPQTAGQAQQQGVVTRDLLVPAAVNQLFSSAGGRLHNMRAFELCQCLWAAAWLQPDLGPSWSHALNQDLQSRMHELAAGDICLLLWSLPRLRGRLMVQQRLLRNVLLRSQELMLGGLCSTRDLTSLVWSYWRLCAARPRPLPSSWVTAFSSAFTKQLQSFDTRQLGVTLRACALLCVSMSDQLLDDIQLLLEVRSAQLSSAEHGSLMSSLAMLRQQQQQHWTATSRQPRAALQPVTTAISKSLGAAAHMWYMHEDLVQRSLDFLTRDDAPACSGNTDMLHCIPNLYHSMPLQSSTATIALL